MPEDMLSHVSVRTLIRFQSAAGKYRLAEANARILHKRDPAQRLKSFSKAGWRALRKFPRHTDDRLSEHNARTLLRLTPDFRWIDMFKDIIFPHDISEGSDAATRFNTQVNEVASGHDQRLSLWDYPKMEYNIAYGVRTMEQLHDLIRFFRVSRGKLYSFRFLDNLDHTSSFAVYEESREAEDITPFDQLLGVGDHVTTSFQLLKHYDFETETATRPIFKPIEGTVVVGVGGDEITWFTVNHSTGIVTINSRVDKAMTRMVLTRIDAPSFRWRLTVPNYVQGDPTHVPPIADIETALPVLMVGEKFKVISGTLPHSIFNAVCIASTPTQLDFYWTAGVGGDATADFGGQLTTNNIPDDGEEVTAGYQFHVPVRFDTDRIPVKLEYYGVGSANEITLVEVRPDEE